MKRKLLPVVLLAALSLTACGINTAEAKPAEDPVATETPAADAQPTEIAAEAEIAATENANTDGKADEAYADYDKMLGDMKLGLENGLDEPILNGFALADSYMTVGESDIPGYLIKDINGDGVDELIFGMNIKDATEDDADWDGIVYDMFTMVDGKMTQVVDGWARNRYYLCTNGAIANVGSDGAAYTCYTFYDFDGKDLKVRESYFTGYKDEAQTEWGWFFSDKEAWADDATEVSEEEARQAIAAYTYDKQNYIPFSDYNG